MQLQLPPDAIPTQQRVQVGAVVDSTGKGWVVLVCHEATGSHVMFLDADAADVVARELVRNLPQARSGLIVAGNGEGST